MRLDGGGHCGRGGCHRVHAAAKLHHDRRRRRELSELRRYLLRFPVTMAQTVYESSTRLPAGINNRKVGNLTRKRVGRLSFSNFFGDLGARAIIRLAAENRDHRGQLRKLLCQFPNTTVERRLPPGWISLTSVGRPIRSEWR